MSAILALAVMGTMARASEEPVAPAPAEHASAESVAVPAAATAPPASAVEPAAEAKGGGASLASHGHHPAHRSPETVLNEHVAALAKAFGLTSTQQEEVRKILVLQSTQLRQVWSDPARTSADRIGTSNAINQGTEDRIRSILTDEQRKQYLESRQARAKGEQSGQGLDYWMDQMQGKQ